MGLPLRQRRRRWSSCQEEHGVAALSGTAFGDHGEGYLRLSYANSEENLLKALERIEAATRATVAVG